MSEPGIRKVMGREAMLGMVEECRDERDHIYAATVNPRRNVRRAIAALDEGDALRARFFLDLAKAELDSISRDYYRWMEKP